MRVALVGVTHPFRGGISHYTTLLCRALRRSHDVYFASLRRQYPRLLFPGSTQFDLSTTPLEVENDPCIGPLNPWSWMAAARRIRRFRPDLAVICWWNPFFAPAFGSIGRLVARGGRGGVCYLCHNVVPHESSRVDDVLSRYAFSPATAFVTHSAGDADELRRLYPTARVYRSPHPTYAAFADGRTPDAEEARARLGLRGREVVLFFGFVREYKGLRHLLDAMLRLDPAGKTHLLLVGEFYDKKEGYADALGRLRRRGQLTLVDRYVENEVVSTYFEAAHLVVVPYVSATQSGIVQMAYGFGKPVIATSVGGLPEVVRDGETGFLVPPADAGALAAAIRRYFESDARERFPRAVAAEKENYSWQGMVETLEMVAREAAPAA